MTDVLFALAYLALPIAAFVLVRSLTWVVAALGASVAVAGALITFGIERGHLWNLYELRWISLGAFAAVLIAAIFASRSRRTRLVPVRHQALAVLLPVGAGVLIVVVSRLLAAQSSGLYTAVGFLVQRTHAEDNAKWLDFTGQLVTGNVIEQGVALGGPLQVVLVAVSTVLAAISWLLLGGVNEVFVASNTIIYAEFGLAALSGLVLAPIAEQHFGKGSDRRLIASPLVWTGIAVIGIGSFAASGLGHLTLQFVMMTCAFWVAAFLVASAIPLARTMASIAVVGSFLVWFPLAPVSLVVIVLGIGVAIYRLGRARSLDTWVAAALWLAIAILAGGALFGSLRYLTVSSTTAAGAIGGSGGGVAASAPAFVRPALDLLYSQGGTEQVAPLLALLAMVSAVLAAAFITEDRGAMSWVRALGRVGPVILIAAYAVALAVIGTWWAGQGPNYGALKTTYLATMVILSATLPLALAQMNHYAKRTTLVQVAAIAGVIYLLAVDGLLPRAATYLSPEQWPSTTGDSKGMWWPAEVQWKPEQTIASLPIACAYLPDTTKAPTALPDGQKAYACTRLLSGLSGADTTGLPLVNWLRREWYSNERAWDNEYPALSQLPESVRRKNFILLDEINNVIGLESVQSYLNRFKPPWAQ